MLLRNIGFSFLFNLKLKAVLRYTYVPRTLQGYYAKTMVMVLYHWYTKTRLPVKMFMKSKFEVCVIFLGNTTLD